MILLQERKSGKTVLHMAAESNNVALVTALINSPEVDVNMLTYSGLTAYDMGLERQDVRDILAMRKPTVFCQQTDSSSSSEDEMVSVDHYQN